MLSDVNVTNLFSTILALKAAKIIELQLRKILQTQLSKRKQFIYTKSTTIRI